MQNIKKYSAIVTGKALTYAPVYLSFQPGNSGTYQSIWNTPVLLLSEGVKTPLT